jgi:hypothetical protein
MRFSTEILDTLFGLLSLLNSVVCYRLCAGNSDSSGRLFFGNFVAVQLVTKYPAFYETQGITAVSQGPGTESHPVSAEFSSRPISLFL